MCRTLKTPLNHKCQRYGAENPYFVQKYCCNLNFNCRRSVWANYCLSFDNNKLLNDDDVLQNFGVRNNSQVCSTYLIMFGMAKYNKLLLGFQK